MSVLWRRASAVWPALVMVAAIGATIVALSAGRVQGGQPVPSLSFEVGATGGCAEIGVGDEIEAALVISHVEDLQAWEATLTHDFSVVRVIEQDVRVFLEQGNSSLFDASEEIPDNNGRHLLSAGGFNSVSSAGPATLATITFEGIGTGVSTIDIPQTDIDANGSADLGAVLSQLGGTKIGDNNGDAFFDGPVQKARIAVDTSCAAAPPTEQPTDPPTPKPATPTPSPTVPPTTTATPVAPTQTTSPTPSGPPGDGVGPGGGLVWGDANCSASVDPIDSLLTLRFDAGLSANTGGCPAFGEIVDVENASPHAWGDVDCSDGLDPVDALKILRYDAGLSVSQDGDCPPIGSSVTIS